MNPELSNPKTFVGTLYPRKFESDKTSRVNFFRKNLSELAPWYGFQSKYHKIRLLESRLCFMY